MIPFLRVGGYFHKILHAHLLQSEEDLEKDIVQSKVRTW